MTGTSQLEAGCFRYYLDGTMLYLGTSRLISLLSKRIAKASGFGRVTMKYEVLHPEDQRLHEGGRMNICQKT
jgi:hypothetical protein